MTLKEFVDEGKKGFVLIKSGELGIFPAVVSTEGTVTFLDDFVEISGDNLKGWKVARFTEMTLTGKREPFAEAKHSYKFKLEV